MVSSQAKNTDHSDFRDFRSRINDRELCWRRFHRAQVVRERDRLRSIGTIRHPSEYQPQCLIKTGDDWVPQIKTLKS